MRVTKKPDEAIVNVNQILRESDLKCLDQEMDFLEFCNGSRLTLQEEYRVSYTKLKDFLSVRGSTV